MVDGVFLCLCCWVHGPSFVKYRLIFVRPSDHSNFNNLFSDASYVFNPNKGLFVLLCRKKNIINLTYGIS